VTADERDESTSTGGVVSGTAASGGTGSTSYTFASKSYHSVLHLWSALHQARLCSELEQAGVEYLSADGYAHGSWATGAAISSVAFLEALVNETLQNASDRSMSHLGNLDDAAINRLAWYWKTGERHSALAKFQAALVLTSRPSLITGASPYQEADLLFEVRNALVHFKPKMVEHGQITDFDKKIAHRFEPNALLANSGNPYFPAKMLGAGFASWATRISQQLAEQWLTRMDLGWTIQGRLADLPTP
jgi:hypothetical protein